ncbi:MAG: deferrochelatase/peroxidase EfeB [Micromonosporaceae bacterium]|jgi:deferrochelatase/peroxidase EfeB|nr:deferrochelatase/peroxidase EfeB [Micromonosporaceae bacterium]
MSRRTLLASAGAGIAGAGIAGAGVSAGPAAGGASGQDAEPGRAPSVGFHGAHQAGIVTPPPGYLSIAGFDLVARTRDGLAQLLRTWTGVAAALTTAGGALTVTFGLGPSLFADDRLGLAGRRPAPLVPLPPFRGEALDPGAGGGDLCVQACADSPTAAHHAVRALLNAVRPQVGLRWRQNGFRDLDNSADPRGMFGFRDGTSNLDIRDDTQTAEHLWVSDGPEWMHGGTYLVVRRIRLLLDTWDRTDVAQQEAIFGRRRDTNVRLDAGPTAHVRLASPDSNGGATLLRRGFSYDAGVDPNGLMDAGLIFICFQRDPRRQFVPIQQRLAVNDALNAYSQHRASGVFACPPGCHEGSWIGEVLFS